jgi:uncharacterized circularly permuted ATP-grasp superfamily protein
MLTNRRVMKRIFPIFFVCRECGPIEHYTQALLSTLRSPAPEGRPEPTIVLLSPGVFLIPRTSSTLISPARWGLNWWRAATPVSYCHDNIVYMRTTTGLRRVDVIYRRVDDDFG